MFTRTFSNRPGRIAAVTGLATSGAFAGALFRSGLSWASVAVLVAGCAATPQSYVELQKETLGAASGRVGVAMTPLPKIDTRFPGADCLLCLAAASLMNSSLTSYTEKLPPEGLPELKATLAELIHKKGAEAVVIADDIKMDALPDFASKGPNVALKDFTGLKQKYAVDKVLVVDVTGLGMYRNYSAYVPTSDPRAEFTLKGYLVNLTNNTYEWYQTFSEAKGADGSWDEPPSFPGLTNAYFQVLEQGKDALLGTFK